MIAVGAYTRMSAVRRADDPLAGRRGVRRQLDDIQALARGSGWLIGKVYEDNDTSAHKERRNRPHFEELLRDPYGYRYQCRASDGGCGGVSRVGPPVEEFVEREVLRHIGQELRAAQAGIHAGLPADPNTAACLRRLERERTELHSSSSREGISPEDLAREISRLDQREAVLRTALRGAEARRYRACTELPAVLRDWATLPVVAQRSRLREIVASVVVHPAGRGRRFDPALVEIVWQTPPRPVDS